MLKSVLKTQNIEKEKEVMILMFLSYFVPMTQSYAGIISILSVHGPSGSPDGGRIRVPEKLKNVKEKLFIWKM